MMGGGIRAPVTPYIKSRVCERVRPANSCQTTGFKSVFTKVMQIMRGMHFRLARNSSGKTVCRHPKQIRSNELVSFASLPTRLRTHIRPHECIEHGQKIVEVDEAVAATGSKVGVGQTTHAHVIPDERV